MDGEHGLAQGEALTFGQTIEPRSFLGLSLKNGLLNIVTLTLYRFWGKTEVRRRIWSRVSLNGEPFEYTGKGQELFLGFLMAMAVVGLPYLALILAIQFVSPLFALLLLPLYFGLFVLIGAAIFMAFRYISSRTTWRGVRFQLTGSAAKFGWSYLGYGLLTGLTFGWFAPAMSMRLEGKLWSGLAFGDKKLRWERSSDENLYGPFAIAWIVGIVGYGVFIAAIMPAMMASAQGGGQPDVTLIFKLYGYALIYALVLMVASAAYHAAVMRAVVASIRLDEARFAIDLKATDLIVLSVTNALLVIFSLGFLVPMVAARTVKFVVSRLSSTGVARLVDAHQAPRGSKTGEGLADAFDLSPF